MSGSSLPRGAVRLVMADEITVVVPSSEAEGRVLVVEIGVPPGGGPPPLHTHPPDELFHVIAGSLSVFRGAEGGTEQIQLEPGGSTFVPGGVAHTFRNFGERPARLLAVYTPGPMMEAFFAAAGREAGAEISDPEAEVTRVLGIGAGLGMVTLDEVPAPSW